MKVLNWLAWISAFTGAVFILLGVIAVILPKPLLNVPHNINFFHAANTFLLMAILLFIVTRRPGPGSGK
jgi:hypothetical protein